MKTKLITATAALLFSQLSFAHCPYKVSLNDQTYCAGIEWMHAEQKIRGEFRQTENLSPQRVPMRAPNPTWIFSKVQINLWMMGDKDHKPIFLEGLRFFPYMTMLDGHHHGASHKMSVNEFGYELSQMALHEMPGCWSVRWTFDQNSDTRSSSEELFKVLDYENLSAEDNFEAGELCAAKNDGDGGDHNRHHNH